MTDLVDEAEPVFQVPCPCQAPVVDVVDVVELVDWDADRLARRGNPEQLAGGVPRISARTPTLPLPLPSDPRPPITSCTTISTSVNDCPIPLIVGLVPPGPGP